MEAYSMRLRTYKSDGKPFTTRNGRIVPKNSTKGKLGKESKTLMDRRKSFDSMDQKTRDARTRPGSNRKS